MLTGLHRGAELSYGELAARVRSVAWSLAGPHRVRAGDRVAVLSRNDARVFEVVYACALLGAIVVPLNWRLTPAELSAVAADAEPSVLICESAAADVAAKVAEDAGIPATVAWASEDTDDDGYESLATASVPADWDPGPVQEDAIWRHRAGHVHLRR